MQNNLAIKVTNLSKKYSIGKNENNLSLAERLRYLFRKKKEQENQEEFYALKDINFEIKKGEAVGIIGRNGAGKSTLLKILSRVTEPTEGKVEIYGTVASVLEVGMGFHPELTGRENVYLSGTMMGIPKKQLEAKFDEIVEFAGVEKFIDTPVKHYSSGMYVRLAFSVVANVDADILLFDEVLSVGDLAFQMKCGKKIKELAEQKKTMVLVSHNTFDIQKMCQKIYVFELGKIEKEGTIEVQSDYIYETITSAYNEIDDLPYVTYWKNPQQNENNGLIITEVYLDGENHFLEESTKIVIKYNKKTKDIHHIFYEISDIKELPLFIGGTPDSNLIIEKGIAKIIFELPANIFNTSVYNLTVFISTDNLSNVTHNHYNILRFTQKSIFPQKTSLLTQDKRRPLYIKPKSIVLENEK
jgi:lipopolysaccharide transport system ATP-binding protein